MTGATVLPYPLSRRDMEADTQWAHSVLERAGLGPGRQVLFIGSGAQWAQDWPYQNAAMRLGGVASYAESSPFDAYRVEMFTRRFPIHTVLGLSGNVLDGLEQSGHDIAKVFGGVHAIFAFPDARKRLVQKGVKSWTQLDLGIGYAFSPPEENEAVLDNTEWLAESLNGGLSLSARNSRASPFVRFKPGVLAEVNLTSGQRLIKLSAEQ